LGERLLEHGSLHADFDLFHMLSSSNIAYLMVGNLPSASMRLLSSAM